MTPVGALAATTPYVPMEVSGELVGSDPFLAWQVESVLQHPISQQRPDLAHFSLDGATTTAAAGSSGPGGAAGAALLAGAALIVLLLGGATLARVGRRSMALRAAVLLGMFVAAGPLAALAVGAVLTASQAAPATAVTEARPAALTVASAENVLRARALATPAVQAAAPAPPQQSPAWLSLVGIEQAIAHDHDLLAQNENAIAAYNAMLPQAPAAPATPSASLPVPAAPVLPSAAAASLPDVPALPLIGAPRLALPSAPVSLAVPAPAASAAAAPVQSGSAPDQAQLLSAVTGKLTQLVAAHGPLAAAYAGDLQNEYDYFLAVVRSPDQQSEILHAAAQANPAALTAVTYDIQTVYTQLAQESAISAAEVAGASPQPGWAHWVPPSGPISFHAPVGGVVTQGFGPTPFTLEPPIRYDGIFYPHFHTGLDIAAPVGTPVGAAASGIVILATASRNAAGYFTGYGNYVVIEHGDGFVTLYGHLERLLVTTGQTVVQGQVIGLLGSTGWSTGPHVHFEVRDSGVFVDPAPYIASQLTR